MKLARFGERQTWRYLNRPISVVWCTFAWIASCGLFFALEHLVGGVGTEDAGESLVPALALAHGHVTCMYPPVVLPTFTAPVYSVIAATLSAVFGVGHNLPFPSGAALGPHCQTANVAITKWLAHSGAIHAEQWFAYSTWIVFAAAVIALFRTTARGRTLWEPVAALALAATPPVLMTLTPYFHPEDLVCLGFVFASLAALRTERYGWAGVLLAGALLSQQFAILAVIPMVLTLSAPAAKRLVPVLGGVLVTVIGVLALSSHGHFLNSLSTTGDTNYTGQVWIAELHVRAEPLLTIISRGPPLVLIALLSLWARRLPRSDATLPLLFVAGFALRIGFEVNIFGYYFVAIAVSLILADVIAGRVRPLVIVWLVTEWLFFNPFAWPKGLNTSPFPFASAQIVLSVSALALALGPLVREAWRSRSPATDQVALEADFAPAVSTSS